MISGLEMKTLDYKVLSGIYFLYQNETLNYIGKAINITNRVYQHLQANAIPFNNIKYVEIADLDKIIEYEKNLIIEFKPPYNKESNPDFIRPKKPKIKDITKNVFLVKTKSQQVIPKKIVKPKTIKKIPQYTIYNLRNYLNTLNDKNFYKFISGLNNNEQSVIIARIRDEATLQATGELMGFTRERARQIQAKAMRKLLHKFIQISKQTKKEAVSGQQA